MILGPTNLALYFVELGIKHLLEDIEYAHRTLRKWSLEMLLDQPSDA